MCNIKLSEINQKFNKQLNDKGHIIKRISLDKWLINKELFIVEFNNKIDAYIVEEINEGPKL